MLYLGIDHHAKQLTLSLRDDGGDVILNRQVSTEPKRFHQFFEKLQKAIPRRASRRHRGLRIQRLVARCVAILG